MTNQLYLILEIYMKMKLGIGLLFQEQIILYLYLTALELDIFQKIFIIFIRILILLQTYIEYNI